jgi:hypothetical protein
VVETEPRRRRKEKKMLATTPAEMTMACCQGGRFCSRSASS